MGGKEGQAQRITGEKKTNTTPGDLSHTHAWETRLTPLIPVLKQDWGYLAQTITYIQRLYILMNDHTEGRLLLFQV